MEEEKRSSAIGCIPGMSILSSVPSFGREKQSANAIQHVSQGAAVVQSPPSKSRTFKWFGGQTTTEDATRDDDDDEIFNTLNIDLEELLLDTLKPKDLDPDPLKTTSAAPQTPAHERRRSWPFNVSLATGRSKVAPEPTASTQPSSTLPEDISVRTTTTDISDISSIVPQSPATHTTDTEPQPAVPSLSHSSSSSSSSQKNPHDTTTTTTTTNEDYDTLPAPTDGSVSATRRLWKTISGVRKGDKITPINSNRNSPGGITNKSNTPTREITVESLVHVAQQLKPGQHITDATRLMEGLYRLDSRAVAALLKDLAKAGMPHRASELFDYLRGLGEGEDLSHLADLYTYTTVISQCVGHQQLRRALELVAEMRSNGIQCNVHTYSALMSVCVKCNECELAMDVYEQLLSETCTPNLVTYNILIDAYSKTSQWSRAIDVLDTIRNQGLAAEARTYNAVIACCGKCGQAAAAVEVYRGMLRDGVEPTGTTYTSVVSAFGRTGQVDEALEVYQEMKTRGCERNVITFSSLISVCERAGRADVAVNLLQEMRELGVKPNVVTFNGLIGACVSAGEWDSAMELHEEMIANGCRPDATTFSCLLHAADRSGRWKATLTALDQMQQRGVRPDACSYNSALNALWTCGRLPALKRAVQVLSAAQRQGPLRLQATSPTDATAAAYTPGAAILVTLKWLADMRDSLNGLINHNNNPNYPHQQPLALHHLPPFKSLLLTRVKHAKVGLPPVAVVKMELAGLLEAFGAPVTVDIHNLNNNNINHIVQQVPSPLSSSSTTTTATTGILVTVNVQSVPVWAANAGGQALLSVIDGIVGAPVILTATIIKDDKAAEMQCGKAFTAVQNFESTFFSTTMGGNTDNNSPLSLSSSIGGHNSNSTTTSHTRQPLPPLSSPMSPVTLQIRQDIITCITALSTGLGLREETSHDAVQLCDRLLSGALATQQPPPAACAAALLLLASRQSGEAAAILNSRNGQMVLATAGLPQSAVVEAEVRVVNALGGDGSAISPLRVLQLYLERLGCDVLSLQKCQLLHVMVLSAINTVTKAALSPSMGHFPPSVVAAACLVQSRNGMGVSPVWPSVLASMTGLHVESDVVLKQCLEMLVLLGICR